MKNKVPTYYSVRIFLTAFIIYTFILGPIDLFVTFNHTPGVVISQIDEIERKDAHQEKDTPDIGNISGNNEFFFLGIFAVILLVIFNLPFKRYFRKLRKNKPIPDKLTNYCHKHLLKTPLVNSLIIALPFLVIMIFMVVKYVKGDGLYGHSEIRDILRVDFYLMGVIILLVTLFSYQWHKNRVQLKYIDYVYDFNELKTSLFRKSKGIHAKFWISNIITTLLPLLIVILYIALSFSLIADLGIQDYADCHNKILLGKYYDLITSIKGGDSFNGWFYINSIDSLLMLFGISVSVVTALIYVAIVAKWTSRSIEMPVKELLSDMNTTGEGDIQSYSIVRSNDEIGQLTAGYNLMVTKLKRYFNELKEMNRNLELKVKQRTKEIQRQKEEIESQRDEITQQRDQLSKKNTEINDSIVYARRIQEALLPSENQFSENLPEHFILFKPRDIVSGDFYWIKTTGDYVIFAAADCTGHGVPGAFMSMLGLTYLNEIVHYTPHISPNLILNNLREQIKVALKQHQKEIKSKDGMDMSLVTFNNKTYELQFAGAYNPLYLIRSGELYRYKADRMPIGVHRKEKSTFTNHTIQLYPGDVIYLFSDGYKDQFGGPDNEKFKSGRFRQLLLDIHKKSADEQKEILTQRLNEWMGDNEQLDDILVMGVKIY